MWKSSDPRSGAVLACLVVLSASWQTANAAESEPRSEDTAAPTAKAADALRRDLALIATLEDRRSLARNVLTDLAKDPRSTIRARAIRTLGRLQERKTRAVVTTALSDPDAAVRREAIFALGQLPNGNVRDLEARFPEEPDPDARRGIIDAVGTRGNLGSTTFLTKVVVEKDDTARAAALRALGKIAKRNRGRLTDVSPKELAKWLVDANTEVRAGAAYVAQHWSQNTDEALSAAILKCATDADEGIRATCVRALIHQPKSPTAALQARAGDASWRVRVEAIRALGKLNAEAALLVLLKDLALQLVNGGLDPVSSQIHPAMVLLDVALTLPPSRALAKVGKSIQQVSKPETELSDPEKGGRALGLSHIHCRAAALVDRRSGRVNALRKCGAADYSKAYREVLAVRIFEALPPKKRARALRKWYGRGTAQAKVAVLEAVGAIADLPVATELVLEGLQEADPAVVAQAATVAGRAKLKAAAPVLVTAYGRFMINNELETVQAVFEALGRLKEHAAAPFLEEHVFHPNAAVRKAAVEALKAIKGHEARFASRMPMATPGTLTEPDERLASPSRHTAATIHTSKGKIGVDLFAEKAPLTVKNFVRLARKGFYDGLTFHRVSPNFVTQGGDPRGDGWGGPGYTIRCEISPTRFERGILGMALAGKDTGGSQFFIMHSAHPHLDGAYTAFGVVSNDMTVVDTLVPGDKILNIEIRKRPEGATAP